MIDITSKNYKDRFILRKKTRISIKYHHLVAVAANSQKTSIQKIIFLAKTHFFLLELEQQVHMSCRGMNRLLDQTNIFG